jgi:hypothetical protein
MCILRLGNGFLKDVSANQRWCNVFANNIEQCIARILHHDTILRTGSPHITAFKLAIGLIAATIHSDSPELDNLPLGDIWVDDRCQAEGV